MNDFGDSNLDDRDLRDRFTRARRADAGEAPEFQATASRPAAAARVRGGRPPVRWGFVAATATVVALSALAYPLLRDALESGETTEQAVVVKKYMPPPQYSPGTSAPEIVNESEAPAERLAVSAVPGEGEKTPPPTANPGPTAVAKRQNIVPPATPDMPEPRPRARPLVAEEYARVVSATAEMPLTNAEIPEQDGAAESPIPAAEPAPVHGSRSRDFKASVSGTSEVDPLTGRFMSLVNPNSMEEIEVVTSGANVPAAQAQGGFAKIVERRSPQRRNPRQAVTVVDSFALPPDQGSTETYAPIEENDFLDVAAQPLSTFSADVDTASYANVRRFLMEGRLPPANAVRIEELINYFPWDYPEPRAGEAFSATLEMAPAPWNPDHELLRIGLKARELRREETAGSNLVFLIDVSGSMDTRDKLPLLKSALAKMTRELGASDRVAIVVYAGSSGLVLDSTPGSDQPAILQALGRLEAGGSTAGAEGIRLAYRTAERHFVEGGVNRVILATDGDFNVGITDPDELLRAIDGYKRKGIFLTVLGFGRGNLQDLRLEHLADKGNGNYAYIDTAREAQKVLVEQIGGTLVTVAKDVKFQVEFNPAHVAAYRLIGYENRLLAAQDFNDDTKDAGEIGSGHTVTALYELVPAGVAPPRPAVDPLRYGAAAGDGATADADDSGAAGAADARAAEWLTLKVRHKEPREHVSRLATYPFVPDGRAVPSEDFEFASAVAAFGMELRGSAHLGGFTAVRRLAERGIGADRGGYRGELLELIDRAAELRGPARESTTSGGPAPD